MKKTLCFILALSMCVSAFSCSDKKKDCKPKPDITDEEITPYTATWSKIYVADFYVK